MLVPALLSCQTLHVTQATSLLTMQADARALQDGDEPGVLLIPHVEIMSLSNQLCSLYLVYIWNHQQSQQTVTKQSTWLLFVLSCILCQVLSGCMHSPLKQSQPT